MREVGLGHTVLDDQQDDWRRAVRLGSGLSLGGVVARGPVERGGERAGRAQAREARWHAWPAQGAWHGARLLAA